MASRRCGPLADVRVLDLSRVLAGPFCGQILGDLGADVVKLEHPQNGDETRGWGPPFAGALTAYYLSCNRNKRAITLALDSVEGRQILDDLVRRSDVVLENFRASSAEKLGVTPERLLKVNPRIIVCSISGFGRTGPMHDLPGYDFAIQALSGLMSITGPVEGPPFKVGVAVADVLTGLYAAVAVLACLHARKESGHGYSIDLALLDCALAAQVNVAQAYLTGGKAPPRQGNAHLQIVPYQLFRTADSWLVLAVGNDGQWQRFCESAGRSDLAADSRFITNTQRVEQREILVPIVESMMRSATTNEWEKRLVAAQVPHAPVWNYDDTFSSPQPLSRGMRITVRDPDGRPVDLVGSPFHIAGTSLPTPIAPPALGRDTDTVLKDLLGLDQAQLEELHRKGVL